MSTAAGAQAASAGSISTGSLLNTRISNHDDQELAAHGTALAGALSLAALAGTEGTSSVSTPVTHLTYGSTGVSDGIHGQLNAAPHTGPRARRAWDFHQNARGLRNQPLRRHLTIPWSTLMSYSSDIAFTAAVKAVQSRKRSRAHYQRMEDAGSWETRITPELKGFIEAQTSVFWRPPIFTASRTFSIGAGRRGFLRYWMVERLGLWISSVTGSTSRSATSLIIRRHIYS